jgi:hypothetical protein
MCPLPYKQLAIFQCLTSVEKKFRIYITKSLNKCSTQIREREKENTNFSYIYISL